MGFVTGSLPVLPSQAEMPADCYTAVATFWPACKKKLAIFELFGYF
jgi:hypothetical protein